MDFSQILAKGISKIRGTDKDEEEVRKKALAFQKAQGQEAAPEEAPLEEGDLSDYVMPVRGGLKSIISKMKQKGPTKPKPPLPKRQPEADDIELTQPIGNKGSTGTYSVPRNKIAEFANMTPQQKAQYLKETNTGVGAQDRNYPIKLR